MTQTTPQTLQELAALCGGTVVGDEAISIIGAAPIRDVQPGEITLVENEKFLEKLADCPAAAVVISQELEGVSLPQIRVDDVQAAFAKIVGHYRPRTQQSSCGVSEAAYVSVTACIGKNVEIHPGAYIGDSVVIGDDCTIHSGAKILAGSQIGRGVKIYPNAVLYEDTVVGDDCILHANTVLGSYGFGYQTENGEHQLSAQLGNVVLEEKVEVGAGATIDRGTYNSTVIGAGTKIDNQVQVAHNCVLGKHNILCAQVGLAGSVSTGDYVVMAGQVGVRDHREIGTQATIAAKAGVITDIPPQSTYAGIPATPNKEQYAMQIALTRLPALRKQVKELQRTVDGLAKDDQADSKAA